MTLVGEPQNLLIGNTVGWDFGEFFVRMSPVSLPVLVVGLATCAAARAASVVRLRRRACRRPCAPCSRTTTRAEDEQPHTARSCGSASPGRGRGVLVAALALHCRGRGPRRTRVDRDRDGVHGRHGGTSDRACVPAMRCRSRRCSSCSSPSSPSSTSRTCSVPSSRPCSRCRAELQPAMFYLANGVLSAISDNVFVATVYISEVARGARVRHGSIALSSRCSRSRSTPARTCRASRRRTARPRSCSC